MAPSASERHVAAKAFSKCRLMVSLKARAISSQWLASCRHSSADFMAPSLTVWERGTFLVVADAAVSQAPTLSKRAGDAGTTDLLGLGCKRIACSSLDDLTADLALTASAPRPDALGRERLETGAGRLSVPGSSQTRLGGRGSNMCDDGPRHGPITAAERTGREDRRGEPRLP